MRRRPKSSRERERAADAEWFRQYYASEPVEVLLEVGERVESERKEEEEKPC